MSSRDAGRWLFQRLESSDVPFDSKGTSDSAWWSILAYLLPFVLFFSFWIFLMRQIQSRRLGKDDDHPADPGEN